jgi:hypothetical protein
MMSSQSELKSVIEDLQESLQYTTLESKDSSIRYVISQLIGIKERINDEELRIRCLELAVESQRDITGDIYSEKGKVFYRFIKGE